MSMRNYLRGEPDTMPDPYVPRLERPQRIAIGVLLFFAAISVLAACYT